MYRRAKYRYWTDWEKLLHVTLGVPPMDKSGTLKRDAYDVTVGQVFAKANFIKKGLFFRSATSKSRKELELAIELARNLPYQESYNRVPFRAPNSEYLVQRNQGKMITRYLVMHNEYDQDIEFFAEWCGYLNPFTNLQSAEVFMAAAINSGNRKVLDILIQSINGQHAVGIPCRTNIRALMLCDKPEAWHAIEQLLLKAQREEGLRQVILESADELNPQSFVRYLRIIVEHGLLRFSSVFRALITWLPGLWEEKDTKSGERVLMRLLEFLEAPGFEPEQTPNDVYLRLWADAFFDINQAIRRAARTVSHVDPAIRRATARILNLISMTDSFPLMLQVVRDQDHSVASIAVAFFSQFTSDVLHKRGVSEALWQIAHGWPPGKQGEGILERSEVFDVSLKATPDEAMYVWSQSTHELSSNGRYQIASRIEHFRDAKVRTSVAIKLFGDTSESVRDQVMKSLEASRIETGTAVEIEKLLTRKSSSLRKSALVLLAKQSDKDAFASGQRLAASGDKMQQSAGGELIKVLAKRGFGPANNVQATQVTSSPDDLPMAPVIDQSKITFAERPKVNSRPINWTAAISHIESLDRLIHQNRNQSFTLKEYPDWDGGATFTMMLGNVTARNLPRPSPKLSYEEDRLRLPVIDLLDLWVQGRNPLTNTEFNWEIVQAHIFLQGYFGNSYAMSKETEQHLYSRFIARPEHLSAICQLLPWVIKRLGAALPVTKLLDTLEEQISVEDKNKYESDAHYNEKSWRTQGGIVAVLTMVEDSAGTHPNLFTDQDWLRAYNIFRYLDEPRGKKGRAELNAAESERETIRSNFGFSKNRKYSSTPHRKPIPLPILDAGFRIGLCTESDIFDQVRLMMRTATLAKTVIGVSPELRAMIESYVDRMLDVEVRRGELPTEYTKDMANVCGCIYLDQVRKILKANIPLVRVPTYHSGNLTRPQVVTRLLEYSHPRKEETPEICAAAFREDHIKQSRLIELAMLCPHWAGAIEIALDAGSFADAVWWLHAHTKDDGWGIPEEIKEVWLGEMSERSPLRADELDMGSCDIAWFQRFINKLPSKLWIQIEKNAKFASSGSGHARARLYAQAIRGDVTKAQIVELIQAKRNQNAVRAIGLLPMEQDAERDILERYDLLQRFRVESRQFGSMKQASEKVSVAVALENLARSAGYPDPLRLIWALEAKEVEDLKDGKSVVAGEYRVTLQFSDDGDPEVTAFKGDKELKEVPAAAKKLPEIKELTERRTRLKKQAQRMRMSLEESMQRGDAFQAQELMKLVEHPGLRPMLRKLIFLGAGGSLGFLDERGHLDGEDRSLIIAHPFDLLNSGEWSEWQKAVFAQEKVQPFKQVFRELYVLTPSEQSETESTRYGGHQLQPRQAIAILGKRGWVLRAEEGVSKTLHSYGLVAHIEFDEHFYTPADVEGLTIKSVFFTKAGTWVQVPLAEIPPKVFSETMRDVDLIVSVASMVGIDPEASESSVEMRANVVRETALLMRLDNLTFAERHIVIRGKLGEYSVNIGSAVVHQRAKGELVIVAVRQPQRGRLFLPFLDDDPRTAEIVSKVILLARDDQIKDPTILSQIVRG